MSGGLVPQQISPANAGYASPCHSTHFSTVTPDLGFYAVGVPFSPSMEQRTILLTLPDIGKFSPPTQCSPKHGLLTTFSELDAGHELGSPPDDLQHLYSRNC